MGVNLSTGGISSESELGAEPSTADSKLSGTPFQTPGGVGVRNIQVKANGVARPGSFSE